MCTILFYKIRSITTLRPEAMCVSDYVILAVAAKLVVARQTDRTKGP